MRLAVEDVLGISECGHDALRILRHRRIIAVPVDDLDGSDAWDEWCLIAVLGYTRIAEKWEVPSFIERLGRHGPLNESIQTAYRTAAPGLVLWLRPGGLVVPAHPETNVSFAVPLDAEFTYAREELEPLYGQAPFG